MQVAINPSLYDTAQIYAERQGVNVTMLIENFLERFISSQTNTAAKEKELPDIVVSLMGAADGQLDKEDLNGRKAYYEYLEEKHK